MARSLIIILLILVSSCRAEGDSKPITQLHQINLGHSRIQIKEYMGAQGSDLIFIQLHHDEQTAVNSAMENVRKTGGKFISIENKGQRNISFKYNGETYRVDPNRIFSARGREASLEELGDYSGAAEKEVEKLAGFILSLISPKAVVIAIHNNTNHKFSIDDYLSKRSIDAREVYINEEMDKDDFIFTTDRAIYDKLSAQKINAVLQHNENAFDDGSLSVWFGKQGRVYINIEAEHGHTKEQERMVNAVIQALKN